MMKQNVRLRLTELERHLLTMFTDLVPEFQLANSEEDKILLYTATGNNGYAEFLISYDIIDSNEPITIDSIELELMYSNTNVSSGSASKRRYKLTIPTIGEKVLESI